MGDALSCDESDLLLAMASVSPLEGDERRSLTSHLEGCPRCRRAGAGYRETAERMAMAAPEAIPPASLRSRIMAEVHRDAARRSRPALRAARSRLRWLAAPRTPLLAAGSACAVAVAAAVIAFTHGPPSPPRPGPEETITYTVSGTTAQPLVSGTVTFDPSTPRAIVDVQNLAPPPPGGTGAPDTYELWLIRRDGHAVPAGYLAPQPDGRTWSTAVRADLRQYRSVAATLERPGGSQAPLGTIVFVGTVGMRS